MYLETVIAREDGVKEVKLFQLGPRLLQRYRDIFHKLFAEDRELTLRRDSWGFVLGLISTAAFYGAYAWIVMATVHRPDHAGRHDHVPGAVSAGTDGGCGQPVGHQRHVRGQPLPLQSVRVPRTTGDRQSGSGRSGPDPATASSSKTCRSPIRAPTQRRSTTSTLHIRPGESLALVGENGSGKTTLIKLLTRLYEPTEGRILLDGVDCPNGTSRRCANASA